MTRVGFGARPLCWLVVKLGTPQDKRLWVDRSDERSKRDSERTKGGGEMCTLFPSFPSPHLLIRSLSFFWLKSKIQQNKQVFIWQNTTNYKILFFFFKRFSSFRIGFVCANASNRSVTRYNAEGWRWRLKPKGEDGSWRVKAGAEGWRRKPKGEGCRLKVEGVVKTESWGEDERRSKGENQKVRDANWRSKSVDRRRPKVEGRRPKFEAWRSKVKWWRPKVEGQRGHDRKSKGEDRRWVVGVGVRSGLGEGQRES